MKPTIYITLLLLCGFLNSHAQTSDWEEAYNKLPQKDRDEFYEYARDFLENNYYIQLSLAIEEGMEFRRHFIENIFGDENNAGAARFQPEFLPESDRQRFLTPAQYLQELSAAYKGKSDVEFHVSNVREDEHMHGYTSPTNCFAQLDYDLEIEHEGRTLLKRRCRMCCLFPNTSYKLEVRLMQIEPLEDIYLMAEGTEGDASISEETRFQEAMEWYIQGSYIQGLEEKYLPVFRELAEGLEEKYLPVFRELAEKGFTEAEYQYGICMEQANKYEEDYYPYPDNPLEGRSASFRPMLRQFLHQWHLLQQQRCSAALSAPAR